MASIHDVGEAGGLREWGPSGYDAEIPSMEIWSWSPVAPAKPEPQSQTSPQASTKLTQVLSAWRAAERQLQDLLEASPMRTLVGSEIAKLRAEYQRLFALASR